MLTLIGSVLGFGTSFLPKILGYFEDKRDQAHELAMMDKQLAQQLKLGEQRMEMLNIESDISEIEALHEEHATITRAASQWCISLAATVRPLITYGIFGEFLILTFLRAFNMIDDGVFMMIWNEPMQALWAAVASFWFGQRSFNRK